MKPLDRYTCAQAFRRLDDYLDRELGSEEVARVEAHLETCSQCADEFRFEGTVIAQVRDKLRRLDVPEDLLQRLAAKLQASATEPR